MRDSIGLPITLDLAGQTVLLVGDGAEAAHKLQLIADSGAAVKEVAPAAFDPALLDGAALVLVTARDAELAARVYAAARARRVLCWCSDMPERSDFAMPAVARLGAARIAVSTGGASPALAARMRAAFEGALGARFGRFVDALAQLRNETQRGEPDAGRRRARLTQALDGFAIEITLRLPSWFDGE